MKEVLLFGYVFEGRRRYLAIRSSFRSVPFRLAPLGKCADRFSRHRAGLRSVSWRLSCDRSCPEGALSRRAGLPDGADIPERKHRQERRDRHLEEPNMYQTARLRSNRRPWRLPTWDPAYGRKRDERSEPSLTLRCPQQS